jgi:hypothetical protein
MNKYMVISPHTEEECSIVVHQVIAAGYTTHTDWGCMDGDHTGYAVIEAESHEQALLFVPSLVRPKAKAVMVVRFYPEEDEVELTHTH